MSADGSKLKAGIARWSMAVTTVAVAAVPDLVRPAAPLGQVTPTSRAPGGLRASIAQAGPVEDHAETFVGRVVAPVIQARTTDKGSPPHIIRARNAPMLRFWWANGPAGAGIYYFRSVNHPGNEAQNWWEPALREAWRQALPAAARSIAFR